MLDSLLTALEPPAAFAGTGLPFWDDEHISRQMLAAHLDAAFDGASRRPAFIAASIDFIAAAAPPKQFARLADFGCGPGLYALPLAKRGYAVTGYDLSRRSIAFAKAQAKAEGLPVQYKVHNYLQPTAEKAFDLALLVYCDYGALSAENRKQVMANIFNALAPGGRFFLDVFTTQKLEAFKEEQRWLPCPKGGFWSAAPHIALHANRKYPGRISLEQTVILEDGGQKSYYIWNQYFTPDTLAREAEDAGFRVLGLYDDAAGAPHTGKGETLAALLERPVTSAR